MKAVALRTLMLSLSLTVVAPPPTAAALAPEDRTAVRQVAELFLDAWARRDEERVLNTLDGTAVLILDGRPRVQGKAAIADYLWPPLQEGATVLSREDQVEHLWGDRDLAYVSVESTVSVQLRLHIRGREQRQRKLNQSTILLVLRRNLEGEWKVLTRAENRRKSPVQRVPD